LVGGSIDGLNVDAWWARWSVRVAVIAPPWFKIPPKGYGGIEVVIYLLVEGLVDRGHEVTLCTVATSSTRAAMHTLFDDEMKAYLDAPPSSFLNVALTHALDCYKALPAGGIDIVHDHTWKEGLLAAAFLDIPVVHTVHGPFNEENKRFYGLFKDNGQVHFVTISDFQRKCLPGLNYAGTVYNGILLENYPYAEEKEDFYFYMGRFNEEKAPHLACQVAKELGAKLILAGKVHEDEERRYFNRRIIPFLSSDIQFVGELGQWSQEKLNFFSRAKGYLYPIQWDEPFGLTMAEAMACGTPVVAFRRGAAAELVDHETTGFIVDTMEQFFDATQRVSEIEPHKCRERVERMFTAETMVGGYESVYRKVLDAKRTENETAR
jgi:glycosyltransferase involved in cell wall biosynthesis